MAVAAQFISAARDIHFTAGATRQAVLSLLKHKDRVSIREWA